MSLLRSGGRLVVRGGGLVNAADAGCCCGEPPEFACGSRRVCARCENIGPDPMPPVPDERIVGGHHFTYDLVHRAVECQVRGGIFDGPFRYECETTTNASGRGAFGLAIQWGRAPTIDEVEAEFGIGPASRLYGDPFLVRPNVWARMYDFLAVDQSPSGVDITAYRVGVDEFPQGGERTRLGISFGLPRVDQCVQSDGGEQSFAAGSSFRRSFSRSICAGLSGGFEVGVEDIVTRINPLPGAENPWAAAGVGVGDPRYKAYTEVLASVEQNGGAVVLGSNWEGPDDIELCTATDGGGGGGPGDGPGDDPDRIDPGDPSDIPVADQVADGANASMIEDAMGLDPQRRCRSCGQ